DVAVEPGQIGQVRNTSHSDPPGESRLILGGAPRADARRRHRAAAGCPYDPDGAGHAIVSTSLPATCLVSPSSCALAASASGKVAAMTGRSSPWVTKSAIAVIPAWSCSTSMTSARTPSFAAAAGTSDPNGSRDTRVPPG